jgi:hypothetical protein
MRGGIDPPHPQTLLTPVTPRRSVAHLLLQYYVFKQLADYIIPHCLGFAMVLSQP